MFYQDQNVPPLVEVEPSLVDCRGNYYMINAPDYVCQVQTVQKVTLTPVSSYRPEENVTYVNRKQFKYILKRREARMKLIAEGRIQPRRLFLHKSRREHALKRVRTEQGTFKPRNEGSNLIHEEEEAEEEEEPFITLEAEEVNPQVAQNPTLQEHLIRKGADTRGRLPPKMPAFKPTTVPKPLDFRSRTVTTAPWGCQLITPRENETKQLKVGEKYRPSKVTSLSVQKEDDEYIWSSTTMPVYDWKLENK